MPQFVSADKPLEPGKRCNHCGVYTPLTDFYNNKRHKDGLSRACKPCTKAGNRPAKERKKEANRLKLLAASPPEGHKFCCSCGDVKPIEQFRIKRNGKAYAYCFSCDSSKQRTKHRKKRGAAFVERPPQAPVGSKWCSTCKKMKPIECFRDYAAAIGNNSETCKACAKKSDRRAYLKRAYGITPEQYEQMLQAQGGLCAICRQLETVVHFGKIPPLSVDHDHNTNINRELLCMACNHLVGRIQLAGVAGVEAALAYLRKHRSL